MNDQQAKPDYKKKQKKYRILSEPTFYPKGTKVEYTTREGDAAEWPNAPRSIRYFMRSRRNRIRRGANRLYRMDGLTNKERVQKQREQAKIAGQKVV